MQATYTIPEKNIEDLKVRVEKLNKRAAKLGVAEVMLEIAFSHEQEYYATKMDREYDIKSVRNWFSVTVTGVAPKIEGWTFAATLNHTSEGNIVASVPGSADLPKEFRSADPACDHCQMTRRRNDTFVVLSDEGEYKQVGRNCLTDFLGHKDPHGIAKWAELLSAFDVEVRGMEDEDFGGGKADPEWSLESFLTVTALMIRKLGWVSRTYARDFGGYATADAAMTYLRPFSKADHDFRKEMGEPSDEDRAEAVAAMEWVETHIDAENASDYEYNLLVVARAGRVTPRTTGLAASMVSAYHRHVQKEIEREKRRQAAPVPTGRIEVEGVVSKLDTKSNDFGTREVMTVVGDEGWAVWGTQPRSLDVQPGDRVRFTATIDASDDPSFGFFKRPSKAEVVERAA